LAFLTVVTQEAQATADTEKDLLVEFESLSTAEDSFKPIASVFHIVSAKDGALGGFIFSEVTEEHAQAYAGLTLRFRYPGLRVTGGSGIGIEQGTEVTDRNPLRLACFLIIEGERHMVHVIAETGANNREFVSPNGFAHYAWKAHPHFDFGLVARRHAGIGPRIDFWLHRPGLGVAFSPLYDPERKGFAGLLTFSTGY
jgi:hypothetical protein